MKRLYIPLIIDTGRGTKSGWLNAIRDSVPEPHDPISGAVAMDITFVYPKKMYPEGTRKWKNTRPDLDNITKVLLDGLAGIVYMDDKQVVDLHLRKVLGSDGGVHILYGPAPDYLDWTPREQERGDAREQWLDQLGRYYMHRDASK